MDAELLRPIEYKSDEIDSFLHELFISSRPDLAQISALGESVSKGIIDSQYKLSEAYIEKKDLESRYLIVYRDQYIGKLYIRKDADYDELVSIAILPKYRARGIGKKIIEGVLSESRANNKYLKLRVAWYNYEAKRLYERIGFKETLDYDVYCEMECK